MVKALLLDADGVVQKSPVGWRDALGALSGDAERIDEFLEEIFAAERPCLTGDADFATALAPVLARWDSRVSVDEALELWTLIEADEAILGIVSELRRSGVAVALATNQQSHRAEFMTRELGYEAMFDHLLYSCALGHAKPAPGYFLAALDALGIDASDALFIDDHDANIAAARAAGLFAEQYHLSYGVDHLRNLLAGHGLPVAE